LPFKTPPVIGVPSPTASVPPYESTQVQVLLHPSDRHESLFSLIKNLGLVVVHATTQRYRSVRPDGRRIRVGARGIRKVGKGHDVAELAERGACRREGQEGFVAIRRWVKGVRE
jgi:hypothetical protein